ncbi:MAG: quinolinate synthase NadA [Deltaproteobacteria bacterium]|nr:quinolinate synthase NadA [Deltaproteobacteria bacterium]
MQTKEIIERVSKQIGNPLSDIELSYKIQLVDEILEWKKKRNAVILGHNYMEPILYHTVTDFKGDSLELSRKAVETDKEVIVFCGVRFMAETAKILNPDKTVLLPSENAGCSLASSISGEHVRMLKKKFPVSPIVVYVNTSADVKAEADSCCTSSNAVAVVKSLKSDRVIFLPDEFLAKNTARQIGKHIKFPKLGKNNRKQIEIDVNQDYHMIGWRGRCEVHERFTVQEIQEARKKFPDLLVLAHPECPPEVVEAADFAGSTTAMAKYVGKSNGRRYLLLTECAMGDNIAAVYPEKEIISLSRIRCPHMNQITLEATLKALKYNQYVIEVPEDIQMRARGAIQRMLELC